VGKFAKRPKAKSVSASGGGPLTRGAAPGPRWELRPRPPIIGPHTCMGGLQLSNAGTE